MFISYNGADDYQQDEGGRVYKRENIGYRL